MSAPLARYVDFTRHMFVLLSVMCICYVLCVYMDLCACHTINCSRWRKKLKKCTTTPQASFVYRRSYKCACVLSCVDRMICMCVLCIVDNIMIIYF